jgi:SAM-dependent methyltransferase
MNGNNSIDLLFGGMEKLGPGSNADTLHVLRQLPKRDFDLVVDAGCGTGRQTLVLAKELGTVIHAIDTYQPFLNGLERRAKESNLERLIEPRCMDMQDIPAILQGIDLLWAEGSAYSIGFANALATWARAIKAGGIAVVSELSWLREQAPDVVKEFFLTAYPDMHPVEENIAMAQSAGYREIYTHVLPKETWVEGYYDILQPRATGLVSHPDQAVRDFARETLKEIEIFERADGSYGYVFYVLERA